MSRSSATDDRAAVEPLVALSAVLVVGVLLSTYAAGLERSLPTDQRRAVAEPTADAAVDLATRDGLVRPERLDADAVAPDGYSVRVTVRTSGNSWTDGPSAPSRAQSATRRVSVHLAPGTARPGRLRVEVWT